MPRLVLHEQNGPIELRPQPRSVWLCGCGLSQNRPHCDGSHKLVSNEPKDIVCVYDRERKKILKTCSLEK